MATQPQPFPRRLLLLSELIALAALLAAPAAAARWTSLGPRGVGSANALAFAPSDSRIAYAATQGGGVARSEDGGKSWVRASHGLLDPMVTGLAVDPRDANVLYAVTQRGLSRSRNGGRSWFPSVGPDPRGGYEILSVTTGGSSVYIGTRNGIFRSTDGGLRWVSIGQDVAPGDPRFYVPVIVSAPSLPRVLYASYWGARSGLFVSTNGGLWWHRIADGRIQYLAVDPRDSQVLYTSPGGTSIARTRDGGQTWTRLAVPMDVLGLAVDPFRSQLYAATTVGLWKSEDGGAHWADVSAGLGLASVAVSALALDPLHPGTLLAGVPGDGIFRSTDGAAHWLASSDGLVNPWLRGLAIAPGSGRIFVTAWTHVLFTDDDGASWTSSSHLPDVTDYLAADPTDPMTLYAAGGDYPLRSTDAGATWEPLGPGITRGPIVTLAVDPSAPRTLYAGAWEFWTELYGGTPGVFKSTDGGATWTVLPLPNGASGIALDPRHPQTVYATQRQNVFRSLDGGRTWSLLMNGAVPTLHARLLGGVAVAPSNPSVLAAHDDQHVFVSTDGGRHWTRITGFGLEPSYISMAFDPLDDHLLFVGGANGVARLSLNNLELRPEDGDLFNLAVTGIAFDPAQPGALYVVTDGGGVLRTGIGH